MTALWSFETSITVYQSHRRNALEDFNLQQHNCDNPRTRGTVVTVLCEVPNLEVTWEGGVVEFLHSFLIWELTGGEESSSFFDVFASVDSALGARTRR